MHLGMMPWVLRDVNLGANVLEIGPGPGVTTDWLRERVPALTCVEIDPELASSLKRRLGGTNVTVAEGDATQLSFPDASFDSAVCFTMLHHVPSRELQDRLLTEACRVLKPG
ncbi:MAG: class I SAM-dependent methyltransferase, partial [Chloroflexi bacterium]